MHSLISLLGPKLGMHPQRPLIPQNPHPLLPQPISALHLGIIQLEIKVPQDLSEDEPHLGIRQLASDAVARSDAEGLGRLAPVRGKSGICIRQPSLG